MPIPAGGCVKGRGWGLLCATAPPATASAPCRRSLAAHAVPGGHAPTHGSGAGWWDCDGSKAHSPGSSISLVFPLPCRTEARRGASCPHAACLRAAPGTDSSAGGRETASDEDALGDGASVVPAAWVQTCPRPPLRAAAASCCPTSRGGTEGAAAPSGCIPPRAGGAGQVGAAEMGPGHPQGVTQIAQSCPGRQRGGERAVMPTPSGAQVAEGGFSAARGVWGAPTAPLTRALSRRAVVLRLAGPQVR